MLSYNGWSSMGKPIEKYVAVDGVRLWTVRQGEGALPVVLCHGGPGAYDTLGPIADMIDDLAAVYRYDQRGSGRSDRVGPYTVDRFVNDLEAIRRHYGIERWIVGGHSAGANLALRYAMVFPARVAGLMYLNGTGLRREWVGEDGVSHNWSEYHRACEAKLTEVQRMRLASLTDRMDRQAILSEADYYDARNVLSKQVYDPSMMNMEVNAALGHVADSTHIEEASKLDMPALLLHGGGDPRPLYPVRDLVDTLRGARLRVIEKLGHYPYLEEVGQVRELLREFVSNMGSHGD